MSEGLAIGVLVLLHGALIAGAVWYHRSAVAAWEELDSYRKGEPHDR